MVGDYPHVAKSPEGAESYIFVHTNDVTNWVWVAYGADTYQWS